MLTLETSSQKPKLDEIKQSFKDTAFKSPDDVRRRYGDKPISLLRLIDSDMRFPLKIRNLMTMLWKREDMNGKPASRFIIKGPRGGGKSKFLGAFGFVDWYLKGRDIVDMGGSLEQAKGVYNYFAAHCFAQPAILSSLPKDPRIQRTVSDLGNYFKAVAASQKQVRGPHPHTLMIDEACETRDDLIESALPMVTASKNPLVVITSTFHKIFGKFQEMWDAADQIGYTRFSWDVLDVTMSFDPAIFKNEELLREIHDLAISQVGEDSFEARVAGRTGDPEGWFSIENVIQAWREKSSLDWFDVEFMGARPSAAGMVNKPEDVDACVFDLVGGVKWPDDYRHRQGLESVGGVDWGFSSMTAVVGLHAGRDQLKIQHHNKTYTGTRSKVIIEDIIKCIRTYGWKVVYCDSAGKFENADLKAAINAEFADSDYRCRVVEVVFGKEKVGMLGNYRAHFQRRLMRIPNLANFKLAVWQHKRYRYEAESDKPIKKDDHIPDATMCALFHWPLGKVSSSIGKENVENQRKGINSTITGGLMEKDF